MKWNSDMDMIRPKQEKFYKGAVFFDLDGTLLDHSIGKVPESARKAIKRLKENGYLVCLATGRDMATHYSAAYLEEVLPDVVIHMNGTRITAFGDEIFHHTVDRKLLKRIFAYADEKGFCVGTSIGDYDYFTIPEMKTQADLAFMKPVVRHFRPVEELMEKNLPVMGLSFAGIDTKTIKKTVEAAFPELELFCFNRGTGADVVERGFSKAAGIERVCRKYRISLENTWAFGDSPNDVPMFSVVAHSVAMGNAEEEVKKEAEYITEHISKDGIRKGLEYYGLI